MLDDILDDQPKIAKPPSPKLDPRSGLSAAQQQALHIDHGPPLPPEPEPFNPALIDHGIGIPPIPANPYLPPPNDFDQTPSDFSYNTNHSDPGYLSGTPGGPNFQRDNFGRNQFQNSNQFGGNFGGGGPSGHFDYNNRSQIPPPQSPFIKPGGFGSTPLSYDSGMSHTPSTPQTPQPVMQNDLQDRLYDSRDRGNRSRDKRDRDYGNSSKYQDSERNKNKNSDWSREPRDRYNREGHHRDKGRRDWKYERDNEYTRRERDRERNRNFDRDRRRNDFKEPRKEEREIIKEKVQVPLPVPLPVPVVEKEIPVEEPFVPTPPPPTFTPKPAEPKEEDEPRSMSLESRIQSLLSGFRSPEPAKPAAKEETPPPAIAKSSKPPLPPSPAEDSKSGFESSDSGMDSKAQNSYIDNKTPVYNETPAYNQTPLYNEFSTPNTNLNYMSSTPGQESGQPWPNNFSNGPVPITAAQPSVDDEEDRMSLDSNDSGGGNASIEINPQAMKPDPPGGPVPLMSIPTSFNSNMPQWPQSGADTFNVPGGFMNSQIDSINRYNNFIGGGYNQNYMNQFNNELNNEDGMEEDEVVEKQEITFSHVLEDFVHELKEILTKDLCKKMVENSGFKTYENWWDKEEERTKVRYCCTLQKWGFKIRNTHKKTLYSKTCLKRPLKNRQK